MPSHVKLSKNYDKVAPRLTMFAAIDNHGEIYFSLFQRNSDSLTVEMFMTYLVSILNR